MAKTPFVFCVSLDNFPDVLVIDGKFEPVYTYGDTKILNKIILEGEKASDEEKKFQLEGIKEVVRYCQNDVTCRRVQVLRYFGEVDFEPADCHKNCNNCIDSRESQEVDLTEAGIEMIKMVQSFAKHVSKAQCLEAFRGSNTKTMREKGIDLETNPNCGKGKSLSRDQCDHLIDHLLVEDALQESCVSTSSKWNNMYIKASSLLISNPATLTEHQLGPKCNQFLRRELKSIIKFKVAKPGASTSGNGKPKAKPKANENRKPRSKAPKQRDIYEDEIMDADSWEQDDDPIDHFPEIREAVEPCPPKRKNSVRKTAQKRPEGPTAPVSNDSGEPSQRCFSALCQLRDQIAGEESCEPSEIIEQEALEMLSLTPPTGLCLAYDRRYKLTPPLRYVIIQEDTSRLSFL